MANVAFIGLGVMGYPMAGHLLNKGGHRVTVYNRTAEKAARWTKEHGGGSATTPRAAAQGADFVFCCVGNDHDVRAVAYGDDGALAGMKKGAIYVEHTTASAVLARELDERARALGLGFLDAPVSGGQSGAQSGQLGIMVGGDPAIFERAKPVLDLYARSCALIGPAGSGQLTKMVNQICVVGVIQGLAEGLNFGRRAGLDMEKVLSVISKGAATSWQMENRWKTMLAGEFQFGFAADWMRKDLGICLAEAKVNGARLPVTALIEQFYAQVQARGGGRWDSSSLINLLAND
ncbi:MAG TPA: NAD(P)-dependent oxidoreductase [Burkholderiales bacterium]|jgi:3-hydroxyisobutyrate dehydrogenase-like beta-hydroxyacid dehydrogenase|nr:NAD(P)-dependent oxidoreductase [Burkholderiales bacterium]